MKVKVATIVFITGDEFNEIADEFGVESIDDVNDDAMAIYLLNWYYGDDELDFNKYDASDINTPFLGYACNIDEDEGLEYWSDDEAVAHKKGYLFSRNDSMGYVGLSRFKL